jgi:pimeloyl-ACP methyl ester carboxylesterase
MPTALLLHGWVMNRAAWAEAAVALLERGYGIVMPDLPGHGDAAPLPTSVGPAELFDAIAELVLQGLDRLGLRRVPVAGYSMGATTALSLLKRAPQRFERALLLGPVLAAPLLQLAYASPGLQARLLRNLVRAVGGARGPALRRVALALLAHVAPVGAQLRRRIVDGLVDGGLLPSRSHWAPYSGMGSLCEVEVFLESLARTDFRIASRYFAASCATRFAGVLERFDAPVLLATGTLDALSPPRFCRRRAARTPGHGRLALIDGADHAVLSQAPAEVGRLLVSWLEEPVSR